MANTTSLLGKLDIEKPYKTHGRTIPLISGVLVLTGILLALVVVFFRVSAKNNLAEDILLATLALLLATAGIALSALANGMRTKLMLEAANIEAQHFNSTESLVLRQKLLAAVSDRMGSIVISQETCALDATNTTAQLTCTSKDKSENDFKADEEVFKLTWRSSNLAAATVDGNGVVTRVATGKASIVAHFNGFQSKACVVNCA